MTECFVTTTKQKVVPIISIEQEKFPAWLAKQTTSIKNWLAVSQFKAKPGEVCFLPDKLGGLRLVLFGLCEEKDFWMFAKLPQQLPAGIYAFDPLDKALYPFAALAWGLEAYRFDRYTEKEGCKAKLLLPAANFELQKWVESIYWLRDLINTPCEDMGPTELSNAAKQLAHDFNAKVLVIVGDDLIKAGYPAVHAVGRGSARAPHLIDFRWGDAKAPKLTLVGKGVCFDTGGLDIKSTAGMALMKKDMSGAAHALALARMIMAMKLPVCLRVLIPAVENSVDGNSYRPGDVLATRAGISVEVTNTDAEGRLVLADALTEAVRELPDRVINFATLTGAATIALGADLPAMFCNDQQMANNLLVAAEQQYDPLWQLPLYQPYKEHLKSEVADCVNAVKGGYGGAITAALFLEQFINVQEDKVPWAHFDLYGWHNKNKPGRPAGGDAVSLRAIFTYLKKIYT